MKISAAFSEGRLTAYLAGELDHHEARQTIRQLEEWMDAYLPRDCVLDLSGLRFMDSSGIAVILRVNRRMKDLGGRVWIENPSRASQRVIDASGLERLVPVAIKR